MSLLLIISKFLIISICLTVFYFLLFKNKSSFAESRIFLLLIPFIAFIISVIAIPLPQGWDTLMFVQKIVHTQETIQEITSPDFIPVQKEEMLQPPSTVLVPVEQQILSPYKEDLNKASFNYLRLISFIYLTGVILYLCVLFYHLYRIHLLCCKSDCEKEDHFRIYKSYHISGSFSFMKSIFLYKDSDPDKLPIIIAHERLHIVHYHYVDMALMELLTVLFWFNPVIWFIRREIRLTHEFQVDDSILRNGIEREKYMKTILEETAGFLPSMVSGFNTLLIKKRFMKMKNGNHVRHKKLRIVLMIPFLALLLAFFSVKSTAFAQQIQEELPTPEEDVIQLTAPTIPDEESQASKETLAVIEETPIVNKIFPQEQPVQPAEEKDLAEIQVTVGTIVDNSIDSLIMEVSAIDNKTSPITNVAEIYEDPDWDYRASNLTYSKGKYYNPDGMVLSEGEVRSAKKYGSNYLSYADVKIVPSSDSNGRSGLVRIEKGEKETRVTFIVPIYHDSNWIFTDKNTCLIDPKTGDRYMVRRVEDGQKIGVMNVVMGLKGKHVEKTVIFPPLKKSIKQIDYYAPANFVAIPNNGTNSSGSHIKGINIKDYEVKKGKVIR